MNSSSRLFFSLIFFVCLLLLRVACNIEIPSEPLIYQAPVDVRVAIEFANETIFGNGSPFIKVESVKLTETTNVEDVHLLYFYSRYKSEYDKLKRKFEKKNRMNICCSSFSDSESLSGTNCINRSGVNLSPDFTVSPITNQTSSVELDILRSGVYYISFLNCNKKTTPEFDAVISWKNPFGFLSAEFYPLLWFFFFFSIPYLLMLIAWIVLSLIYRKQLMTLQHCIAGVIFLGLVECVFWYLDFLVYNHTGNFVWPAFTIAILTSTLKRTVSRLLTLIVALGYGIVKADLGTTKLRVAAAGTTYFVLTGVQEVVRLSIREGRDDPFLSFINAISVIPAVLIDTVIIWWILISVSRTIQQLQLRKQPIKLAMYNKFFVALLGGGIVAGGIIAYQFVIEINGGDIFWKSLWMFNAAYHVIYFLILLVTAILWRPTENNLRFAYFEGEEFELSTISSGKKPSEMDISKIGDIDISIDLPSLGIEDETYEKEMAKMD